LSGTRLTVCVKITQWWARNDRKIGEGERSNAYERAWYNRGIFNWYENYLNVHGFPLWLQDLKQDIKSIRQKKS